MSDTVKNQDNQKTQITRRDFLTSSAIGMGIVGAGALAVPLVESMSPSADVAAVSSIEIDISKLKEGEEMKVIWRGKPIFIKHRNQQEIKEAQSVSLLELPDPQSDADRVKPNKEAYLVLIGVCTHLGCVPKNNAGDYGGWLCPCHGSHYDSSGRIRKGPAPLNMAIPPYVFINETTIKIG